MNRLVIHHILSRENMDAAIYSGRIDGEKLDQFNDKLVQFRRMDHIFLCGPPEMIFAAKDWLTDKEIAPDKIHFELFLTPGKSVKPESEASAGSEPDSEKTAAVTVNLDGNRVEILIPYNGESILDAALKQGLDLPFACKGGVCATCKARLVQGEVTMDSNYSLEADELKNGFILTCQSHPRSEKVLVDFDLR